MTKKNRNRPGIRVPAYIWVLLVVLASAIAYRAFGGRSSHHPEPRPNVTAADVLPAARYADASTIQRAYQFAQRYPEVLDGLFCYCECARNFGHRSLLSCFESDHGADCEVCLREALLAGQLHEQGRSLHDIRARIDGMFGA